MFDYETHAQLSRERTESLWVNQAVAAESPRPARRALGKLLIRAGERLAQPAGSSALAHEALPRC
ncbi:MAG TPA: hypothetical protein VEG40_08990 [Gaiellaceae bacterium]|nr:hypothetical protein [Gaiellaceae bacterium]